MIKHQTTLICCAFVLLIASCANESKEISSYAISRKDFENIIIIDGYAEPIEATSITCPRSGSRGTIAFLIEDGTWVNEGDILCSIEHQTLQTNYDQLLINLEDSKAGLAKTKADLSLQYALLEAEVRNNDVETQIAHLDSSRLQYYSPNQKKVREFELQIVNIKRKKIESKLVALAIIQQSEVKKLEVQIQRFTNQVESAKKDLEALTLRAPRKGLAVRAINPRNGNKMIVGDVIWSNMPIVSIPDMKKMKMKILASERDYRYINVNDSISYSFDALNDNIAWGKILKKMPVGQQIKEGSNVKYFEIEASLDSTLTMPDPGFTATCYIMLKQVKDTITIPQIAIFEQDSMKVVYVEKKNGYEMRQILLGESSPKEAIVSKGLNLNEKITLSKPAMSHIKNKKTLSDTINSVKQ